MTHSCELHLSVTESSGLVITLQSRIPSSFVRISVRTPATLHENIQASPQFLQRNQLYYLDWAKIVSFHFLSNLSLSQPFGPVKCSCWQSRQWPAIGMSPFGVYPSLIRTHLSGLECIPLIIYIVCYMLCLSQFYWFDHLTTQSERHNLRTFSLCNFLCFQVHVSEHDSLMTEDP
jgi:hypothetical protein